MPYHFHTLGTFVAPVVQGTLLIGQKARRKALTSLRQGYLVFTQASLSGKGEGESFSLT
jgi:hypothetical protein